MRHYAGRLSAFQSTPPARGATPGVPVPPDVPRWISIHAPREGGDATGIWLAIVLPISIHAPREGGDIAMQ